MASARAYHEQATAPFDWDQEWSRTEECGIRDIEHGIRAPIARPRLRSGETVRQHRVAIYYGQGL